MTVYAVGLAIEGVPLPEFNIMAQVLVLTTVQAVMMVSGAVVVSAHSTSVRAANLLASFIVIPVALLIQGESVLMFWGTNGALWWAVLGITVLTLLLVRVGLAHFRREELLGRQIDVLNIRWGWRVFREAFLGGAKNAAEWYLKTIPQTVRKMRISILVVTGFAVAGVFNWFEPDQPVYDSTGSNRAAKSGRTPANDSENMAIVFHRGRFWRSGGRMSG